MLNYAKSNQIPVWTAIKLLDFIKAKDEAVFTDIAWSNNHLVFKIKSTITHSNGITFMIPYSFKERKAGSIVVNSVSHPIKIHSIKGCEYAMLTISPGSNYNIDVTYISE